MPNFRNNDEVTALDHARNIYSKLKGASFPIKFDGRELLEEDIAAVGASGKSFDGAWLGRKVSDAEMVFMRASGLTLDEMAAQANVSKERCRQVTILTIRRAILAQGVK